MASIDEKEEKITEEEKEKIIPEKEEKRTARKRGVKKIPSIILEKLEEKDDERFLTIRFSPKIIKSAPRWKRAGRAIKILKEFINKHVKYVEATVDETTGTKSRVRITEPVIWISPQVNDIIWSRGATNPPKKIRIRVLIKVDEIIRDSEGRPTGCRAELKVFPVV